MVDSEGDWKKGRVPRTGSGLTMQAKKKRGAADLKVKKQRKGKRVPAKKIQIGGGIE